MRQFLRRTSSFYRSMTEAASELKPGIEPKVGACAQSKTKEEQRSPCLIVIAVEELQAGGLEEEISVLG